jgi:CubicO group peptidase (beta-lactamase class C family)
MRIKIYINNCWSAVVLLCLISYGAVRSTPVSAAQNSSLEHTKAVLESLVQGELDRGLPSLSLSLVRGDQIVWSAAWGVTPMWV